MGAQLHGGSLRKSLMASAMADTLLERSRRVPGRNGLLGARLKYTAKEYGVKLYTAGVSIPMWTLMTGVITNTELCLI